MSHPSDWDEQDQEMLDKLRHEKVAKLVPLEKPKMPDVPNNPWETLKDCKTHADIINELIRLDKEVPFWHYYGQWRSACLRVLAQAAVDLEKEHA